MTFEIEIAGKVRVVSIEAVDPIGRAGGRFRVLVQDVAADGAARPEPAGGRHHDIDARQTDFGLSVVYLDSGRGVDAAVTERGGGTCLVEFPHVTVEAVVDGRRFRRAESAAASAEGQQRITAPMPGRVLRILVRPGDEVSIRQGLVVIEAMKMENELTALRAGRIREIAVTEGASVEAGRLLIVLD